MHDGNAKETPNLSLKQLANLFGFLKTDADDNIISIEPDYDEDDDGPEEGKTPDRSSEGTPSSYSYLSPTSHGNGEGSSKRNAMEIETDDEDDVAMEDAADDSS